MNKILLMALVFAMPTPLLARSRDLTANEKKEQATLAKTYTELGNKLADENLSTSERNRFQFEFNRIVDRLSDLAFTGRKERIRD